MDAPSEARAVQIPYDSQEMLPGGVFLLDLPGMGESVALVLGRLFKEPHIPFRDLTAVQLNSPENSTIKLPPSDIKYVRLSGKAGGALKGDQGVPNALTAASTLTLGVPNPQAWSLEISRPPYDPGTYNIPLFANNDSVAVLDAVSNAIDIFDKTQKQWHRTNLPFPSNRVRVFGPWIAAIAEQSALLSIPPGRSVITGEELQKLRRGESPGKSKRQSEEISYKLTVDDLFEDTHSTFPGDLFVHNGLTGASFQIATGQADSEVLLATDTAIFYRVNDELYRAEIRGQGLGSPIKLAGGAEIVQAHWAFLAGSQGN